MSTVRVKVIDLTGPLLDWAVFHSDPHQAGFTEENKRLLLSSYKPSTNWFQAGPLIEKSINLLRDTGGMWEAECGMSRGYGPTPLVAVCRAIAEERFGHAVEIPIEVILAAQGGSGFAPGGAGGSATIGMTMCRHCGGLKSVDSAAYPNRIAWGGKVCGCSGGTGGTDVPGVHL